MLLASLSFGLMNVSVKFVHDMPVSEVVFFRAVVQIVLSLGILFQFEMIIATIPALFDHVGDPFHRPGRRPRHDQRRVA